MATRTSAARYSPPVYLTYTGAILAVVVVITFVNRLRLGDRGWMFTWQLVGIAAITAAVAFFAYNSSRLENGPIARNVGWFAAASFAGVAAALLIGDHRSFLIIIALLQTVVLVSTRPGLSRQTQISIGALSILTWALFCGVTYTHLADWLLNGSASSALALAAFVFSFWLVLRELNDDGNAGQDHFSWAWLSAAVILFTAYALRTDSLQANWIPLHRSYFADVSDFVRQGHMPLWDIPSLYGFLSMLVLGKMPAGNGWQATYELTAVFLVSQALMTFAILRWGRRGVVNGIFAVLFPLATLLGDSISRYPWSGRLYPQGGLRFIWIVSLLFVAFLAYVWRRQSRRVAYLRWAGHLVWIVAIFWTIDNALWATILWVPYVVLDALTYPEIVGGRALWQRLLIRIWPLAALPALAIAAIEIYFRATLHVAPDWLSYVEFTGPFAKGAIRLVFHVQDFGSGWTLLLVLGAVGSVGMIALRQRHWDAFRLLFAAWLAVWGTATYFALEPLDMYVSLLIAVLVPASGIVIFVSRDIFPKSETPLLARLSIAPLAIITVAVLLGEPSRMAAMQWHLDVIQDFPPVHGELASLMHKAGIEPRDPVLVPNGPYWTEPRQGIILPFTRLANGQIVEYRSWLPISPVGPEEAIQGLLDARQQTYIERFLARTHAGGWYITYRTPSACSLLSSHLRSTRTVKSINYSASFCEYVK